MNVLAESGAFVCRPRLWCPREEQEDGRRFLSVFSETRDQRGEEQDAQTGEYREPVLLDPTQTRNHSVVVCAELWAV